MEERPTSVWGSTRFWRKSAGWVTGVSALLLIWLSTDTVPQISMRSTADLDAGKPMRVPPPTVINHKITYEFDAKRGHEVPVIGEKEPFFGRSDYSDDEAKDLLTHGKLAVQAKNCMSCHTLLGNGGYYAPDLTKSWLDPAWSEQGPYMAMTGTTSREEAMAKFLMKPSTYPTHARRMPELGITEDEAKAIVAFLKHMASIDTNGFPRNFAKINGGVNAK